MNIYLQFVELGRVVSIENNHKPVDVAKKGTEVCIKVEPVPGDAPKMLGRHFDETDLLVSKVNIQSSFAISLCKKRNFFCSPRKFLANAVHLVVMSAYTMTIIVINSYLHGIENLFRNLTETYFLFATSLECCSVDNRCDKLTLKVLNIYVKRNLKWVHRLSSI